MGVNLIFWQLYKIKQTLKITQNNKSKFKIILNFFLFSTYRDSLTDFTNHKNNRQAYPDQKFKVKIGL